MTKKRATTRVFQYYIIHNPESDTPKSTVIAKGDVLATDENKALIAIAREIPKEYIDDLDSVDIVVRPF